jgi:hypothetical protein
MVFVAVLAFFLAFLFHGLGVATSVWLTWPSLVCAGLTFLGLHFAGFSTWLGHRVIRRDNTNV